MSRLLVRSRMEPLVVQRPPQTKSTVAHVGSERLRALCRIDDWRNLGYLGVDWLAIAGAIAATLASGYNPLVYAGALVVIGSRQRALANLAHEASHQKLFRTPALNTWLGRLCCAWPLMISLDAYRTNHNRHHHFFGDPSRDPDRKWYDLIGLTNPIRGRVRWRFVAQLTRQFGRQFRALLPSAEESRSELVPRVVFIVSIVSIAAVLDEWTAVTLCWLVPLFTTYVIVKYLAEVGEHAGLSYENPYAASRNWTSSLLVRHLIAPHSDDLYHVVHHLMPGIPHYRLRETHELLLGIPEYALTTPSCNGYLRQRRSGVPSVLEDIATRGRGRRRERLVAERLLAHS